MALSEGRWTSQAIKYLPGTRNSSSNSTATYVFRSLWIKDFDGSSAVASWAREAWAGVGRVGQSWKTSGPGTPSSTSYPNWMTPLPRQLQGTGHVKAGPFQGRPGSLQGHTGTSLRGEMLCPRPSVFRVGELSLLVVLNQAGRCDLGSLPFLPALKVVQASLPHLE